MQHPRTAARSDRLLRTISVGSLAFFGAAIMAVAMARGRWHLALGAGAVIVGANVTTEVFKALVHRPHLVSNPLISFNTLPSGHSTVAASLAAALVLVVPVRLRPLAATLGGLYAGGIAAMTLAAGWHRPSDAVERVRGGGHLDVRRERGARRAAGGPARRARPKGSRGS